MGFLVGKKAVLGYHYPTGKWNIIDIMVGPLSVGADVYDRYQIDKYVYTKFIEAPIKSVDDTGVVIDDSFNLPDVLTLEQSIQNTITALRLAV